jgi:SAM-dependent methyltransferase
MSTNGSPHGSSTGSGRGLRRSARLFADFLHEQDDPARFYGALAADSVQMVADYVDLRGAVVLDVGAGPQYFADAFERAGARYVGCDVDAGDFHQMTGTSLAVACVGEHLPFRDGSVDVAFSSNVLEHVPDPQRLCEELVRVTRPGGIAVASFTNWLSPWGGHETSPWHYLGAEYAVRRYRRRTGHDPKNRVGRTLYPLSIGHMRQVARAVEGAEVVDMKPRYWPDWARPLVSVPGVREIATWNLWIAWRRTGNA